MRAVIAEPGQPLVLGDVPDPSLGPTDVLIDVKAAGLNRADLAQRAGNYPPPPGASDVMGLEVAGVVAATGADVSSWRDGDRVCALLAGGGYAELTAADEGSILPIPDELSFEAACCLPEAMMTVYANVYLRGALSAGDAFLVHGGTSGIGVMAIQMARVTGASAIFATVGSDDKAQRCLNLGATRAINYRTEDFEAIVKDAGGVDVILDMVGGDYVQRNIAAAKLNGRICNIAFQNGFETTVNFGPFMMKRLAMHATTLRARSAAEKREIRDRVLAEFWPAVQAGEIAPVIDSTFDMADAESAHGRMEAGGHVGKILLTR